VNVSSGGGGSCCCVMAADGPQFSGLFHRQWEGCRGARERPDERSDSSGKKLLTRFDVLLSTVLLLRVCPAHTAAAALSLALSLSLSLSLLLSLPLLSLPVVMSPPLALRHLVTHYSGSSLEVFWSDYLRCVCPLFIPFLVSFLTLFFKKNLCIYQCFIYLSVYSLKTKHYFQFYSPQ